MRYVTFAFALATCGLALASDRDEIHFYDGLGNYTRRIDTRDPIAQRCFDQGIMFMFAYNHDEAIRSFQAATRIDPECAMAYWGIALASGQNYNDPSFTPEKAKTAADAMTKATEKSSRESAVHQALINALTARYPDPAPTDRADAEKAYSNAMKSVWQQYPKDADVGALYAESMMNLRPWALWKEDGTPQEQTTDILNVLETVLKFAPEHPLANHLYIHAVEASPDPGKADKSAEALRGKHPALGHLLHMPSHIDIRRGRWEEAVKSNQIAMEADKAYLKAVPKQNFYRMYVAHNHHMLTFAAMMRGQSALALKTIREMISSVPAEYVAIKENAAVADGFVAMPLETLKRFGRWDEILKEPEPPEIFPIARAMWHHTRGVAFAGKGNIDEARKEQKELRAAIAKIPGETKFSNNTAADLMPIADLVLEGEILLREGKLKESIAELEKAVAREDRLRYAEPPDWFVQVRHALGAILLRDKQLEAAEKVYREDLRRWPDNGWSLHGLAQTLVAAGKTDEATKIRSRFNEIWKEADVKIASSCFCVTD